MCNCITLKPISYVQGEIILPGSKSISNRVLLMSALASGKTYLKNLLCSDDSNYMLNALKQLGVKYKRSIKNQDLEIHGCENNFIYENNTVLFLGNAGTAVRPLISVLSLMNKEIIITGDERMKERPIHDLVHALHQGGSIIKYLKKKHYLPICIHGGFTGGNITIKSNTSSQFLTSLLIASPLSKKDTTISVPDVLISIPYIDITLKLLDNFGIIIENNQYKKFYIPGNQRYKSPGTYDIEGDASSATYFIAAAAIKGKCIRIYGITKNSIQGDIQFIKIAKKMGAIITFGKNYIECKKGKLIGIDLDANHIPDAAMTIAILALFTEDGSPTTIRNIESWRVKETDRLYAMSTELRKVGAVVHEGQDFIKIFPPKKFIPSKIHTYNDHRMAMCFSLIALSDASVTIMNPQCVSKTFPEYFKIFNKISIMNK
ncbi:3-phosphoshikimate 1-carboxyvinyltransferase [Buchnera aphidicola]|uniref:3-phosphoshikimate 1-carboxyvinyltransferase n=1 Tax=Buchnera aphidicola TaxID=9 RepID=UPI003463DC18